jgi:hypothetical protein
MKTLLLAVSLALAAAPIQAQVLYGSIVGAVEDPSGASVPGATVTITNTQTAATRESKADDQGRYTLISLLPGTYSLAVSAPGLPHHHAHRHRRHYQHRDPRRYAPRSRPDQ